MDENQIKIVNYIRDNSEQFFPEQKLGVADRLLFNRIAREGADRGVIGSDFLPLLNFGFKNYGLRTKV